MSNRIKQGLFGVGALVVCGLMVAFYEHSSPNTFNPFCTTSLAYRLNVTIETEEKRYSSEVVSQLSKSRGWAGPTNSRCEQTYGNVVSFRLEDNRLILIDAYICPKVLRAFADTYKDYLADDFTSAMREHRKVDVTRSCVGIRRDPPPTVTRFFGYDGFVIDSADNPTRWRALNFDLNNVAEKFRIVSAVAEANDTAPQDQLEKIAPAIFKTEFKYHLWSNSPDTLLWVSRRSRSNGQFTYIADEEIPRTPASEFGR